MSGVGAKGGLTLGQSSTESKVKIH